VPAFAIPRLTMYAAPKPATKRPRSHVSSESEIAAAIRMTTLGQPCPRVLVVAQPRATGPGPPLRLGRRSEHDRVPAQILGHTYTAVPCARTAVLTASTARRRRTPPERPLPKATARPATAALRPATAAPRRVTAARRRVTAAPCAARPRVLPDTPEAARPRRHPAWPGEEVGGRPRFAGSTAWTDCRATDYATDPRSALGGQ